MGIALGLATGHMATFTFPWVILASAVAWARDALGGWSLIRTLGAGFYRLRPVHGFSAQMASSAVILGAALRGGPVSTTHVVSSAIVGAGSAERVQKVRWGVVNQIVVSWFLTIPAAALGALLYTPIHDLRSWSAARIVACCAQIPYTGGEENAGLPPRGSIGCEAEGRMEASTLLIIVVTVAGNNLLFRLFVLIRLVQARRDAPSPAAGRAAREVYRATGLLYDRTRQM